MPRKLSWFPRPECHDTDLCSPYTKHTRFTRFTRHEKNSIHPLFLLLSFIYIHHTKLLKCERAELSRRRLSNLSRHLGSKNENSFYSSQGEEQAVRTTVGHQAARAEWGGRVVIRRGRPSNCVNPDQWAISQSEDRSVGSVTNERSGIWHILKSVETSGPPCPACPCVVWKHRMMPVTQWGWSAARVCSHHPCPSWSQSSPVRLVSDVYSQT